MKVNLAVCGKFHYGNYVRYVERARLLNQFIYSHRLSTGPSALRVPPEKLVNVWIKEYLLGLHVRLFDTHGVEQVYSAVAGLWERLALLRWQRCDLFHLMIDGTGLNMLRRARREGSVIVAEPLYSHPEVLQMILHEEHERLGLKQPVGLPAPARREIESLALCDRLLVASRLLKKSFVARGFDERRVEVIPYGVDPLVFHPPQAKAEETNGMFRVICVAQITPRKGHIYLLEAWKKLRLPRAELLFIGPLDHLMKPILARYEGLFKHIPSVPHAELHRYYGASSVFVLPSVEDGFAYVCAEALACSTPVITTDQTGAADIIRDGTDGFVVPSRSPEAIATHLELLYSNHELRREMSEAAASRAATELTWEQYALKLCRFYETVQPALKA